MSKFSDSVDAAALIVAALPVGVHPMKGLASEHSLPAWAFKHAALFRPMPHSASYQGRETGCTALIVGGKPAPATEKEPTRIKKQEPVPRGAKAVAKSATEEPSPPRPRCLTCGTNERKLTDGFCTRWCAARRVEKEAAGLALKRAQRRPGPCKSVTKEEFESALR